MARASHNECKTDANICAGGSKHDANPDAFIYLPTGTCQQIVGGTRATDRKQSSSLTSPMQPRQNNEGYG